MTGHRLRVGVAGWFLQFPYRGVGRYSRLIAAELARAAGIDPIVLLAQREDRARLARGASGSPRAVLVPQPFCGLKRRLAPKTYEIAQRVYWEQIGLPLVLPRLGLDVLYSPYHTLPIGAPRRSIVTIHDLIPYTETAYQGSRFGKAYFALIAATVRRASTVIADSEWTRRAIVDHICVPADRIRVVPPGVERLFHPCDNPSVVAGVVHRLGLPDRYLLYVGGADLRKNIGVLLVAMAALRDRVGADPSAIPPLVIAAASQTAGISPMWPDWRAQARSLGLARDVHFVESIDEQDLPAVYGGALAFCFPSRAEGFGLTPLEAMACGTPVLCANSSSLPEVAGDAALLLPADDVTAWAEAIARVCGDANLRSRLRIAGLDRASRFTWERTGDAVAGIIRAVAGRGQ